MKEPLMRKFTFSFDKVLSGILKRDIKKISVFFFFLNKKTLIEIMQSFMQRHKN